MNTEKATTEKRKFAIFSVIARLFQCAGIMLWFIICAFGWVVPIGLQNDGYSTVLQLIAFVGWLLATVVGIYKLADVVKISF